MSYHKRFLSVILAVGFVANSYSQTLRICPDCKVKTLTEALSSAGAHDTLIVGKGLYKEANILIDKPVHIVGEGRPVIDGEKKGYILQIKADSGSVKGLTLKNPKQSYTKDYAAVHVSKSKRFVLEDNILEDVFFGFLIENSHHGVIRGNRISSHAVREASSGNGLHFWHCSNMLIYNNEANGLRDGIYLEFVKNSRVIGNKSYDNLRYGLHFMFSNHNAYSGNLFKNNGAGVAVMFSKFINMTDNIFIKNWGTASYGLLLKEIYDARIENNTFEENTIGIHVEGSTRIDYIKNNFIRNGWAVKIAGACYANVFKTNNFLHNSFDLSYNSNLNDNAFTGNYWSAYTGYDLDRDRIGDVPYRPVKLFSYVVGQAPESILLLRSLFIDMINFSEKVSPVFTPSELVDAKPLIKPFE